MHHLKKYGAILILLLAFPIARFIANNLVLEASTDIYAYIPQESDFIIEINTKNFIAEIGYHRLFEETYFMDKVYPTEEDEKPEEKYVDSGIDFFSKVILFREQWADESIWLALVKYKNIDQVKKYFLEYMPDARFEYDNEYMVIQMSPSSNQENLDEHLKKISTKEIKGFTERVNLTEVFSPDKEVNCYIIPKITAHNQLIEGSLSFDFLDDHIAIEGSFTPVPGFNETTPIAYAVNEDKAFSMRSSLNLFHSIYWFKDEKIKNLPEYSQLALDYDGAEMLLVHRNQGYTTPFISYPDADLHFDIINQNLWDNFFDSLQVIDGIKIDTIEHKITTIEGASIHYVRGEKLFEMTQNGVNLSPSEEAKLYFDLQLKLDPMLDNVVFKVDTENPPSALEQTFGIAIGYNMVENIRDFAKMESIVFQIIGTDDDLVKASGRIEMKEKNGHSMVESLSFGQGALLFLTDYF
ncbi:MAG: hypothetical protein GQ574_19250 [Crocinitomix sp.]|nr:hypothetical protein [Crocinitomix sp.]